MYSFSASLKVRVAEMQVLRGVSLNADITLTQREMSKQQPLRVQVIFGEMANQFVTPFLYIVPERPGFHRSNVALLALVSRDGGNILQNHWQHIQPPSKAGKP